MTTYHRYLMWDGESADLDDIEHALRSVDNSYWLDGELVMCGDRDCAILLDVSYPGMDNFNEYLRLFCDYATRRRDSATLIAKLQTGTCLITMQVVSVTDELALEHLIRVLRGRYEGVLVYEGGIFEMRCPPPNWLAILFKRILRFFPSRDERAGEQ